MPTTVDVFLISIPRCDVRREYISIIYKTFCVSKSLYIESIFIKIGW